MKASELIEMLRQFHDDEICVRLGFNLYEIGKNISYDKQHKTIIVDLDIDDVNNEVGLK